MRIPVPRNRLVALTLFGVLLAGLVSVTLAAPTLLPGDDGSTAGAQTSNELAPGAPAPNQNFTPAIQTQSGSYEDHEEGGEYEDEGGEDEHEGEEEGEEHEEREDEEEHD